MSLNDLEEQVERIYIDMENELLLNIAKKLSAGKPMEIDKWDEVNQQPLVGSGEVNEWQLQRLKELNGLNEENAKIIAKYSGKTVEEVNKVFDRAREIGMTRDETLIQEGIKLGILNAIEPDTEELLVRGILSNAVEEILTTFNKQNNSLLASAGDEYRDIVNKISSQVLAGTKTTNKAMQEAVSQLAEKGLTGFTARNGARWNPEGYTKMVIRTNTQNTINRIQDERIQACGGDFIEISSHIGARPLCSQDQGQVFSLSGYSGYIEDLDGGKVKVRPWSSSTYGEPAGILGINCGHSRYMFVQGISKQREMDFTKAENDEAYIEKQRQRQYERTIRNKKREIAMLKQTGAEPSYIKRKQNSLSNTRKEYLEFLDKTGRTRITANEWIGSTSSSQKSKVIKKKTIKQNKNEYKKLTVTEIEKRQSSSDDAYKKFTLSEKEAIDEYSMGAYQDVNDYLNGKYPDYKIGKEITKDIDSAISKYTLTDNIVTYRGTEKKYYEGLTIGDKFSLKMYSSTSLNENIAKTFMEDKENAIMLEIRVPKGTPSLYVGDNSAYEFEAEFLLGRNLSFKVIDIIDDRLIVEVVK